MGDNIEATLKELFPEMSIECRQIFGVPNFKVGAVNLLEVCEKLHNELGFDYLADITAIDWNDRIEVVYQLTNLPSNCRIALRVDLDRDNPEIDSLCSLWKGADFQEREVFDLMGVVFSGHPDLRRILLPSDWDGHPLRKDYVISD